MTPELIRLRKYLKNGKNPSEDLESLVNKIFTTNNVEKQLIVQLCIRTGILELFLKSLNVNTLLVNSCRLILLENFFFDEKAVELALTYCLYLTKSDQPDELIPFRQGKFWGYSDSSREIIINCIYDQVSLFSEGFGYVEKDGLWGVLDKNGTIILPAIFDNIDDSHYAEFIPKNCRVFVVSRNGKTGVMDEFGNEIVRVGKYHGIEKFEFGHGVISMCTDYDDIRKIKCKHGLIDSNGNEVLAPKFDRINFLGNDLFKFELDNKCGIVKSNGKVIVPLKYDQIFSFKENRARVSLDNRYGFINSLGEEIVEVKYGYAYDFQGGLAMVSTKPFETDFSYYYMEPKDKGKRGFINLYGEVVIDIMYDDVDPTLAENNICDYEYYRFNEGIARVSLDGYWGYIDTNNKVVIPFMYDIENFSDGLCRTNSGKYAYVDKVNGYTLNKDYDDARDFVNGFAPVCMNKRWGFIDKSFNEVVNCKYDFITHFNNKKIACAIKNGEWYIINSEGIELYKIQFSPDDLGYLEMNMEYYFSILNTSNKVEKDSLSRIVPWILPGSNQVFIDKMAIKVRPNAKICASLFDNDFFNNGLAKCPLGIFNHFGIEFWED